MKRRLPSEPISRRRFLHASGSLGALLNAPRGQAQPPRKTILQMVKAAEKLAGIDVVDVHAHIRDTPPGRIWPQDPESLLEDMDRCGLGLAVFSHLGGIEALTGPDLKAAHDDSASAVRRHPARLRSYLVFHPHQLETSLVEMQRVLEPGSPFVGFKLHGAFHRYPADGASYRLVFQFAHEHRLPILFHVAGIGRDWTENIGRLADEFSGVNLILAHWGPGEDILPVLMKGRRNLFVDTCLSTGRHRQVERIVKSIGVEKVVFATDATFDSVPAGFAKVAFADLPEDEKKLVFGGNARRIFGKRLP